MQRRSRWFGEVVRLVALGCLTLAMAQGGFGDETRQVSAIAQDRLWRETIDLAKHGHFERATDTIRQVRGGGELIETVRTWLEEYEAKQAARKELDRTDFEKYVGYSKARVERKEYSDALGWALWALDCAEDRDAFLKTDWLHDLVNDSLTAADKLRQGHKWRKAYHIYSQLSMLYERETLYQKLEREVVAHLRYDAMFKEDNHWRERIEEVRWRDAEDALEHVEHHYVDPDVDFRKITESGLEQILLLAESKAAQEQLEGLQNEDDRADFRARVEQRLEQVRAAPTVDRQECVSHFKRVVKKINKETVRLPEELVVSELMRGAFEPLDEFTTIIWPQDSKEFEKHTRGDFVGVGISIIKNRANEVEVVRPLEDTPAYRQGIQAGDIITHVDGESLKGFSLNKVVDTITGPNNTDVTLTIRREGKSLEFPLTRTKVRIRSVKGVRRDPLDEERWDHWLDRERGIAYIRVTNFQRNTVEDVDNVMSELTAQGLNGLILDLRRNPGGLLDSAWELSRRFLKRGDVVVSTRGRIKAEDHVFDLPNNGPFADVPLVVLVDERSASASEIVSGAVRDNGRGVVVGERTFGKFSVQNLIPLNRRSGAKLKITTARYYLPSGASLHRDPSSDEWGVKPDIPVRLVRKEMSNVYTLWRDADLLGPPKPEVKVPETDEAEEETAPGEDEGEAAEDPEAEVGPEKPAAAEDDEATSDEEDEDEEVAKLPPLEQPDENNRPKEDPQVDAALLFLRLMLVGDAYPTVAAAETQSPRESAQP